MDASEFGRRRLAWLVLATLAVSFLAVGAAPMVVGHGYAPITDSISESAGQAVQGAWVARSGLLLFGLGVFWLASLAKDRWGRAGTVLHQVFGLMMIAAAVFSAKAWAGSGIDYVAFEDTLHSWAASIMGMGFAFGAMAVGTRRARLGGKVRALDVVAFAASFVLPGLMFYLAPGVFGALQRTMFLVAYMWYGTEAADLTRHTGTVTVAFAERRAS